MAPRQVCEALWRSFALEKHELKPLKRHIAAVERESRCFKHGKKLLLHLLMVPQ